MSDPLVHSASQFGIAALHPQPLPRSVLAGPSTAVEFNAVHKIRLNFARIGDRLGDERWVRCTRLSKVIFSRR